MASLLSRSTMTALRGPAKRVAGRRGVGNLWSDPQPVTVTQHLPFSYSNKRGFFVKFAVFCTIPFSLPVISIWYRWHRPGGLKAGGAPEA
ncbi:hypothetical protein C8J56DRAFT_977654 [Mycena floridula]|nr:hypothetical protein C8J56DRAFT_977654 [Mycena floridula]